MTKYLLAIILFTVLISACVQKQENMVGPTIGTINIIADESIRYIVEQEEDVFERTYPYAKLNISYLPELDMFREFLSDSTRVIMTTRPLTTEEIAFFDKKQAHPKQVSYATSALAFITQKNAGDTVYTYEDIVDMMQYQKDDKLFVIESAKSGISNDILRLTRTTTLPAHFYALSSKKEVVDYVLGHENALGIVDWSDISDSDNPEAQKLLGQINLIGISRPLDSLQHGFVKPYQYNLQDRKYPFTRDLYIISNTGMNDVSSGFAAFIAGEIGQKIILKSGLLPKFQSERTVEINTSSDIEVVK